jgi:hypothetical protein
MDKVSGQNTVIQFFHICLFIGPKPSKTVITGEEQRMGMNLFRFVLVSSISTNWYTFDSKWRVTLGYLPSLEK